MKPIYFKEYNKVYAESQKPYLPLPVYEDDIQGGRVFHCWKLSLKERIQIVLFGKLWINVLNFNKPLQPIKPMIDNPFKNKLITRFDKTLIIENKKFICWLNFAPSILKMTTLDKVWFGYGKWGFDLRFYFFSIQFRTRNESSTL